MPKLSVIIPVYNAEKYLKQCLDSVINQTYKDLEIICINDGSTDTSLKILEAYMTKDTRIQVINQKNQGVSVARNKGLEIATGEYIGFIDADDFLEKDLFKELHAIAISNEVDIIISNFITEKDGIQHINNSLFKPSKVFKKDEIQKSIIPYFLKEDGLNSCCNKIYKADLIHFNKISFPIGVTNGEDALFNLQIFNKATRIIFTDYSGYHYREVIGSATRNILLKDYFKIALKVYRSKYKFKLALPEKEITKLKSIRFSNTIVSLIHVYLKPNKELSLKKRLQYVKEMINSKEVQKAITISWNELKKDKSYYHRFILNCIKARSTFGLLLATRYSNFRNRDQ